MGVDFKIRYVFLTMEGVRDYLLCEGFIDVVLVFCVLCFGS